MNDRQKDISNRLKQFNEATEDFINRMEKGELTRDEITNIPEIYKMMKETCSRLENLLSEVESIN